MSDIPNHLTGHPTRWARAQFGAGRIAHMNRDSHWVELRVIPSLRQGANRGPDEERPVPLVWPASDAIQMARRNHLRALRAGQ